MTLEKHNMLYAVQFALHEYDETGAVCRRTMEMLGARAILLRYEIEGELADAMAKERAKKKPAENIPDDITFTPDDGVDISFKPEGKECVECGTRLTGLQQKFCSKPCSRKHWNDKNPERKRQHQSKYYRKQKIKSLLNLVK